MSITTTRAIVLRSVPFKDNQKILTLFSKQLGILSMILKGLSPKKSFLLSFGEVFCEAEFTFTKKRSDLVIFTEGTILSLHLPLREALSHLQIATALTQAILRSQLPGKPDPELYALLSCFLKQIPLFSQPAPLLACFYLKFLMQEGIFDPKTDLTGTFSQEETHSLIEISLIQQFSMLKQKVLSLECAKRLEQLFFAKISQN